MKMKVSLSVAEMRISAQVGIERCLHVIEAGRANMYGEQDDKFWQRHVEGAMGEMALAKFTNMYWNGTIGSVHLPDVGDLEVRTTEHKDGCLIMHPKDKNKAKFVLAIGVRGKYEMVGWIFGHEGKKQEFVRDPNDRVAAYFVPQKALRKFDEQNNK